VQVDPIKPTLKAPGAKRLKLKYEKLLSSCAFKSNLRRSTKAADPGKCFVPSRGLEGHPGRGLHSFTFQLNLSCLCAPRTQLDP